jgi:hypothetical protein
VPSVSSTNAYPGASYAGVFSRSSTAQVADGAAAYADFGAPSGKVVWARAWARFEAIPSAWYPDIDHALELRSSLSPDLPKATFYAHNSNRLGYSVLKQDGTWYRADWSTPLSMGVYYGLKLKVDASGGTPVITWYVNPGSGWAQIDQFTDTSAGSAVTPSQVRVGTWIDTGTLHPDAQYAGTATTRIDQVVVSTADPD